LSPEQAFTGQLRRLLKAYGRFARGVGGTGPSEKAADRELEKLIQLIESHWVESLDKFLGDAEITLHEEATRLSPKASGKINPDLLKREAAIMAELESDLERLAWFYDVYTRNSLRAEFTPRSTRDIVQRLRTVHAAAKLQIRASRKESRKPKRRRKRKIESGLYHTTIGVGAAVLNIKFMLPLSIGIATGAFIKAGDDFRGEVEDDEG